MMGGTKALGGTFGDMGAFVETYKALLRDVLAGALVPGVTDPTSVGSDFGNEDRPTRELVGRQLVVPDDEVLLVSEKRPVNVEYALLSSMWVILGRDDVAPLLQVNPRGKQFSADGYTLSGAFGHRMRAEGPDQLQAAADLIRCDPSTRRALCTIARPGDLVEEARDVPCASSVQFLARDGMLHAVVTMRSQSAYGVLPYDVVTFRYLLQHVAHQTRLRTGSLHMQYGSLHVYEAEVQQVRLLLQETSTRAERLPRLDHTGIQATYDSWTHPETGAAARRAYLGTNGL